MRLVDVFFQDESSGSMASMPNSFLMASVHALQPCSRSHVVLARRSLSFWEVLEPLYLSLGISKVIMSALGESVWLDLTVQSGFPMSGLFSFNRVSTLVFTMNRQYFTQVHFSCSFRRRLICLSSSRFSCMVSIV